MIVDRRQLKDELARFLAHLTGQPAPASWTRFGGLTSSIPCTAPTTAIGLRRLHPCPEGRL